MPDLKSQAQVTLDPSSDTAYVRGIEETARELISIRAEREAIQAREDALKDDVRRLASSVSDAVADGAGVKTVLISAGEGYVTVSLPDVTAVNSRLALDDKKTKDILPHMEFIGFNMEHLFEETPGPGPSITLRGRWYSWFLQHMGTYVGTDPDVHLSEQSPPTRRLRVEAVSMLRKWIAHGGRKGAAAQSILNSLLRKPTVRNEVQG